MDYDNFKWARSAFKSASQFHIAANMRAETAPGRILQPALPLVVNSAFSLELYLKSLIADESGVKAKGHKLVELFEQLEGSTQAEIRARFKRHHEILSGNPSPNAQSLVQHMGNFDNVMEAANNAFVELRYQHEYESRSWKWMAAPIIRIVREIILERHPDWASSV